MAVHIKNAEIEIFALAIKIISPGVRGHHVFSRHNVNSWILLFLTQVLAVSCLLIVLRFGLS